MTQPMAGHNPSVTQILPEAEYLTHFRAAVPITVTFLDILNPKVDYSAWRREIIIAMIRWRNFISAEYRL
ncbi:MAG: hypothetical protein ABW068_05290 [Candidatus Thiodiazotropha sp.]